MPIVSYDNKLKKKVNRKAERESANSEKRVVTRNSIEFKASDFNSDQNDETIPQYD